MGTPLLATIPAEQAEWPRDTRAVTELDRALVARELGSQYQVVRMLGQGGMGTVWLARDLALHRSVAMKVLRRAAASPDECERFRREARLSAQLAHPGIVPLLTYGETPSLLYMVMRYVPGGSLADRLRAAPMGVDEARRILTEIAVALDYAHEQGVVHRDLKPENILLDRETGHAVLADFGVARRRSWDVAPDELRRAYGTPHYMSPEQIAGEVALDGRSDLYGLGVLGYQMLVGCLPFDGDTFAEIARQHLSVAPVPIRRVAPRVPASVAAAVERCLAKDPRARWSRAGELAQALAHPPGWIGRLTASLRRRRRGRSSGRVMD